MLRHSETLGGEVHFILPLYALWKRTNFDELRILSNKDQVNIYNEKCSRSENCVSKFLELTTKR